MQEYSLDSICKNAKCHLRGTYICLDDCNPDASVIPFNVIDIMNCYLLTLVPYKKE